MPKKKKAVDAAKKQQNEGFIYQFMFVLIVVLAAVMLLRGVQKYYSYVSYMDLIASTSAWAAIGCAVLGTAGLIASAATGKKALWRAGALLLLAAACTGCIYGYYTDGVTMSYAMVIGAGVLCMAAKIYPPEFQLLAGVSGIAAVCYYGISRYAGEQVWNGYTAPLVIALAVVLAAVLALTALAGKHDGRLKLGRWSLVLWQSKLSQMLLILVCIVWAALLALIFALGATFAWYCVLVAALVIFALTVWFTIKLM